MLSFFLLLLIDTYVDFPSAVRTDRSVFGNALFQLDSFS